MIRPVPVWRSALVLGCFLGLTACAAVPQEPRVAMIPSPDKPPDLFYAEEDECRSLAVNAMDADTPAESAVSSALVGAVIGAAVGNAVSGRHHDRTEAGAISGLVIGAAAGLNRGAAVDQAAQRRFDRVYIRCMVSKGNRMPGVVYRPSPLAPPPPPVGAGYYPPPPPPPPPPVFPTR